MSRLFNMPILPALVAAVSFAACVHNEAGRPVVNSHAPFVYVEDHRVVGLDPDDPFVYGQTAATRLFREKIQVSAIGGARAAQSYSSAYSTTAGWSDLPNCLLK